MKDFIKFEITDDNSVHIRADINSAANASQLIIAMQQQVFDILESLPTEALLATVNRLTKLQQEKLERTQNEKRH